jgi:hypothetical protein
MGLEQLKVYLVGLLGAAVASKKPKANSREKT